MYFICYTAVLLKTMCCVVAADAHRNGVRLGVQWLSFAPIQWMLLPSCHPPPPLLVVYVHCEPPAVPGATVLRYRWLTDCVLPWRAELLSSVSWTWALFSVVSDLQLCTQNTVTSVGISPWLQVLSQLFASSLPFPLLYIHILGFFLLLYYPVTSSSLCILWEDALPFHTLAGNKRTPSFLHIEVFRAWDAVILGCVATFLPLSVLLGKGGLFLYCQTCFFWAWGFIIQYWCWG